MEINILFLGGAKRVSVARHFMETGLNMGHTVKIFSYELDNKVPIASIGKVIVGKKWKDENIVKDLKDVIDKNRISIVLAFVDPAISILCELGKLCPDVFIPVSDLDICKIMFDKVLSARWFGEHNISQPSPFSNVSEYKYPVILKPRLGSASKGIVICKSRSELSDLDFNEYLAQEYIENHTEYSVDCYVSKDGIITSMVPRIRLETAGGEAVRSMTVRDEVIICQSEKILNGGQFRGPVTIQFIKDNNTGKVYVMEINPRLGGGVVTSIGAGSRIIEMILAECLGSDIKPVLDWKENTIMVRYFNEVIFYADNN